MEPPGRTKRRFKDVVREAMQAVGGTAGCRGQGGMKTNHLPNRANCKKVPFWHTDSSS